MSPQGSRFTPNMVRELCNRPRETEWLEFKANNANPEEIGTYISALANSAALVGQNAGFLLWGIEDESHEVVGTTFRPDAMKVQKEELENWLLRKLQPRPHFTFQEVDVGGKRVVVLEIPRADKHPVSFDGVEYVRVGSYRKQLKDFPEKERELWRVFDQTPFEDGIALEGATGEDVVRLLDYPQYFHLLDQPLPEGRDQILEALSADRVIQRRETGGWNITNLGAILLAKDLRDFRPLARKAVRVIQYKGTGRMETQREKIYHEGYASCFEQLDAYINDALPANEVIERALRKSVPMFPPLALRELVANALIHQDFSVRGAGPMVEIFEGRVEITNPGTPLVETDRFVDTPPRSRNEALASLMRRFGICEERGTGIDKVVSHIEAFQLPAPIFEVLAESMHVVLFAHKSLSEMDKDDRIRACYLHACLKRVQHDFLTNASIRERFGIEEQNKSQASRYIREAVEAGVIAPHDKNAARSLMKYVPFWAAQPEGDT